MSNVRSAIVYSSFGRYILMLIGLISTVVVARLLTPEEIGTFAIASSIVMIMAEFRILGANAYLIREKELTDNKIRSAYGLTIIVCWTFAIGIIIAAKPLAGFFDISGLSIIFLILSFSFLFAPYISIPDALLTREYRFKHIAIIKISAAVTNLAVTVSLIKYGFSYYSLAVGNVVAVLIQFLLYMFFTRDVKVYRPSFIDIKPIAKLGIYTSISQVVRNAQYTVPDMVIGKLGNPGQVGIFSRGLGFTVFISNLILSGISPVALPYLSDVRKRKASITQAYTRAAQLITGIVWPVLAVASVASLPAIRLMFGEQWDQAAPIASIASFWAIFRAAHVLAPKALIVVGKESSMLAKELIVFSVFLVSIISAYQISGIMGVAYAFVFTGLIDFLVSCYFMKLKVGLDVLKYIRSLFASSIVAIVCWVTAYIISVVSPFDVTAPIISIMQISLILPIIWVSAVFITKHQIKDEIIRLYKIKFSRN